MFPKTIIIIIVFIFFKFNKKKLDFLILMLYSIFELLEVLMKALGVFMNKTIDKQIDNLTSYFWVAKKRGFKIEEKNFQEIYSRSFKLVKKEKKIELLFNLNFVINIIKDVYPNKVNTFLMRLKQGTLPDGIIKSGKTRFFPLGYMLISIALLSRNLKLETVDSLEFLPVFNYYEETLNEYLEKIKKDTPIEMESVIDSFLEHLEKEINKKKEDFKFF